MVTRPGFTIVEVLVALILFTAALLGLAAVSALAAAAFTRAAQQERAVALAAALLDSLAFDTSPGSGETQRDGVRVSWVVSGSAIEVRAQTYGDTGSIILRGARVPRLPRRLP